VRERGNDLTVIEYVGVSVNHSDLEHEENNLSCNRLTNRFDIIIKDSMRHKQ